MNLPCPLSAAPKDPVPASCGSRPPARGSKAAAASRRAAPQSAFTMIEIAISLAVIAFALVAIIGVLPLGLNIQKENREETIINHEANFFINAIRGGARGLDDLTNYVFAITNYVQEYSAAGVPIGAIVIYGYTPSDSTRNGALTTPLCPITNGVRIIGLLGTPQITPPPPLQSGNYFSNYVVAFARAMSGSAVEKFPQKDPNVQATAFDYRMVVEILPYVPLDATSTDYLALWPPGNPPVLPVPLEAIVRSNNWRTVNNLLWNSAEIRLVFRWPLLPGGGTGPGRQVFRTTLGGQHLILNDAGQTLHFFQSQSFTNVNLL